MTIIIRLYGVLPWKLEDYEEEDLEPLGVSSNIAQSSSSFKIIFYRLTLKPYKATLIKIIFNFQCMNQSMHPRVAIKLLGAAGSR